MPINILVRKFKGMSEQQVARRMMRPDGPLVKRLEREKADATRRLRANAARFKDRQQNKKSEFQLDAVIDGRTFMRLHQTDPGIINDSKEFAKVVRDTPEMRPWKH